MRCGKPLFVQPAVASSNSADARDLSQYYLSLGVFGAVIERRVLLADFRVLSYFALSERQTDRLGQMAVEAGANEQHRDLINILKERRLITRNEASGRRLVDTVCSIAVPQSALVHGKDLCSGVGRHLKVPLLIGLSRAAASVTLSRNILGVRLRLMLAHGSIRRADGARISDGRLGPALLLYSMWEPLFLGYNKCFLRSLTLRYFLSAQGVESRLVIGARLRPFMAHAWLQIGDNVLNDSVDHVASFTPVATL